MLLAASTQRTIGLVILAIVFIGFVAYLILNISTAKPEVGSEIELAPNRAPGMPDEELEGTRLDKSLGAGLALLAVIAVGLPLYWLGEPGRQEGLVVFTDRVFADRGGELYEEGANCQACHGPEGVGGSTEVSLTDDEGNFVATVAWRAPALNTVLSRYSEDEVLHVLNYGRNGVMPAWGGPGGGPLTEQQLEYLIHYMRRVQIPESEIREIVDEGVEEGVAEFLGVDVDDDIAEVKAWLAEVADIVENARAMALADDPSLPGDAEAIRFAGLELLSSGEAPDSELYWDYGSILFNNPAAGGTYACARCHTLGWSYDATVDGDDSRDGHVGPILDEYVNGGGFFGANLTGGTTLQQFASAESHSSFIAQGQTIGQTYGEGGSGDTGQMPGWGPRIDDGLGVTYPEVLTQDQIDAIVAFERNL